MPTRLTSPTRPHCESVSMYQSILILNLGSNIHSMRVESLTQVTSVPRSCHNTLPYRSSGLRYLIRLVRATQNQAATGVYYPCKHIDTYNVRFTVRGPYTSGKITHFQVILSNSSRSHCSHIFIKSTPSLVTPPSPPVVHACTSMVT